MLTPELCKYIELHGAWQLLRYSARYIVFFLSPRKEMERNMVVQWLCKMESFYLI